LKKKMSHKFDQIEILDQNLVLIRIENVVNLFRSTDDESNNLFLNEPVNFVELQIDKNHKQTQIIVNEYNRLKFCIKTNNSISIYQINEETCQIEFINTFDSLFNVCCCKFIAEDLIFLADSLTSKIKILNIASNNMVFEKELENSFDVCDVHGTEDCLKFLIADFEFTNFEVFEIFYHNHQTKENHVDWFLSNITDGRQPNAENYLNCGNLIMDVRFFAKGTKVAIFTDHNKALTYDLKEGLLTNIDKLMPEASDTNEIDIFIDLENILFVSNSIQSNEYLTLFDFNTNKSDLIEKVPQQEIVCWNSRQIILNSTRHNNEFEIMRIDSENGKFKISKSTLKTNCKNETKCSDQFENNKNSESIENLQKNEQASTVLDRNLSKESLSSGNLSSKSSKSDLKVHRQTIKTKLKEICKRAKDLYKTNLAKQSDEERLDLGEFEINLFRKRFLEEQLDENLNKVKKDATNKLKRLIYTRLAMRAHFCSKFQTFHQSIRPFVPEKQADTCLENLVAPNIPKMSTKYFDDVNYIQKMDVIDLEQKLIDSGYEKLKILARNGMVDGVEERESNLDLKSIIDCHFKIGSYTPQCLHDDFHFLDQSVRGGRSLNEEWSLFEAIGNVQSNLVNKFNQDFSDLENSRANSLQHLRNLYKEFEETRFILRNDILAQQSNEQMTKLNPHDKHKLIEELCSRPNTPNESVKNQNSFENFSILQKINQYNEHWLMNSVKLLKEINDPDNGFSVGKFEINTKLFDPTFCQDAPDREISEKMSVEEKQSLELKTAALTELMYNRIDRPPAMNILTRSHFSIPQPECMASEEKDWSQADRAEVAEYKKAVEDLQDAQNIIRTELEAKLKKIGVEIDDLISGFNSKVAQFKFTRLNFLSALLQENIRKYSKMNYLKQLISNWDQKTKLMEQNNVIENKISQMPMSNKKLQAILEQTANLDKLLCEKLSKLDKDILKLCHESSNQIDPTALVESQITAAELNKKLIDYFKKRPEVQAKKISKKSKQALMKEFTRKKSPMLKFSQILPEKILCLNELSLKKFELEISRIELHNFSNRINHQLQAESERENALKLLVNSNFQKIDDLIAICENLPDRRIYQCLFPLSRLEVNYYSNAPNINSIQLMDRNEIDALNDAIEIEGVKDSELQSKQSKSSFDAKKALWRLRRTELGVRDAEDTLKQIKSFKITKSVQNIVTADKKQLDLEQKELAEKLSHGIDHYDRLASLENSNCENEATKFRKKIQKIQAEMTAVKGELDEINFKRSQDPHSKKSSRLKHNALNFKLLDCLRDVSSLKRSVEQNKFEIVKQTRRLEAMHSCTFPCLPNDS